MRTVSSVAKIPMAVKIFILNCFVFFLVQAAFMPQVLSADLEIEFGGKEAVATGARGEHVKVIQKLLIETHFYAGEADGIFGPLTLAAVNGFQEVYNLPVNGIVDKNTYLALKGAALEPEKHGKWLQMKATAYSAYDPGNGKYTARGSLLRKGIAAVDPSVIPLGTKLYIVGYGHAVADDTGGSISGNRIDLAFENRREALDFGVRNVIVHILK